jgi:hypothetical protein
VLLVTADHGLVDAPPAARVDLRGVPGFYACLATLPAGDARQVHCFVRPARVRAFRALVRRHLAGVGRRRGHCAVEAPHLGVAEKPSV